MIVGHDDLVLDFFGAGIQADLSRVSSGHRRVPAGGVGWQTREVKNLETKILSRVRLRRNRLS